MSNPENIVQQNKINILIVDDKPANLISLEQILKDPHINILKASSGNEALGILVDKVNLACILLDVQMPDMDGFETAKLIRSNKETSHIPIIFVTAYSDKQEEITKGYGSGAVDYLIKPLNPLIVKSKVSVFCELYRQKQQLLHFRRIIDSSNDAVFILDPDTANFIDVNQKACFSLGYDVSELLKMKLTDVESSISKEDSWESYAHQLKTAGQKLTEDHYVRKDTSVFPVETNIKFIELDDNKFFVAIARDITERKKAEESLRNQTEKLKISNHELEQFAYVASHDLQEPLRKIISFTGILEEDLEDKLDDESRINMQYVKEATTRMSQLIESLLEYSRIGRRNFECEEVECEELIQEVVEFLDLTIEENKAEISWGKLPKIKVFPVLFKQVFQNLIMNAIKFHGDLPPRIRVEVEQQDDNWVFSVRDNGMGFDQEHADIIFEIFQRLVNHNQYQGSGIGLSLCKRIIRKHGGRIWAESKKGGGSTFFFTIPCEQLVDREVA